jgi:DNA-binding LytR/AlgR family response regulator
MPWARSSQGWVVLVATTGFFGARIFDPANIGWVFAMVLAVTAMITAINYATAPREAATAAAPVSAAAPQRPRFSDRLPRHLRNAELHALQAEDHYLRVHTAAGSDLILMRLGDAIPELEPIEGARTHRSWWVARAAVRDAARKDGRGELTLPGGIVAPVSRSAYPELRDKGWFG